MAIGRRFTATASESEELGWGSRSVSPQGGVGQVISCLGTCPYTSVMRGPPAPSGPFLPCTEYRATVSTSSKLEDVRGAPRSSLPPPAAGCHGLFPGCRSRLLSGTCRLSFKYWFLFLLFVFFPDASDLFPAWRYYMPARLCFDNEFSLPLSSKLI